MRISISSTSCQGKTTYIQDFLKTWTNYKTPDKTYRDLMLKENLPHSKNGTEESQKIILDFLVKESVANSNETNIIFDRCPLDNLAYTSWLYLNDRVSETFLDKTRLAVRESLRNFDVIFFVPIVKGYEIPIVEDVLRETDPVYREEIDNLFKTFQKSYHQGDGRIFPQNDSPAMIEIFGNREQRIQMTKLYIDENGSPHGEDKSLLSEIIIP